MGLTERRMTKEEARTLGRSLERFEKNYDYIFGNIEELRKKYLNQCVAVYDGQVVDHGTDLQELVDRLWEKYSQEEYVTIAIEPVLEKDVELLFDSGSSAALYAQPVVPVA